MMKYGKNSESATMPTSAPTPLATAAYTKYFDMMRALLYPSALYVPISTRSSSTMRVMVVSDTKAATKKKMNGNTMAMRSMRPASDLKLSAPMFFERSSTRISGASSSSIFS